MLNIYEWGTCWIQTRHLPWCLLSEDERLYTIHSSAQEFLIPFWMKNKEMGREMAGLLVNLCLYDPLQSICFSFHPAHRLGALFRQRGSDRTLRGDGVNGTERRRTKVLTPLPQSMNKTWPLFFRGIVPFTTFWGANLFFFPTLFCIILLSACWKYIYIFFWYILLLQHQYRTVY